ncbi:cyclic diguanylate phosphodiesterase [Vibrio parahaemolyticus]|nr:EAL domain-containing protein [Vibrio parahaemolyticus]EGR0686854.1 cyclic diguanylate phosphodiesterase [Vibrio parahaemolyticus]
MIELNRVRPLLVSLVSVALCLIVLQLSYKTFVSLLQEQALNKADSVVHKIDAIFFYAEKANEKTLSLALSENNCDEASYELRKIAASIPYVRTTNISVDGYINCTSLWGDRTFEDDEESYVSDKLLLMPGSQVEQNHPLVVLRTTKDNMAALSGLDALHIKQTLFSSALDSHSTYFSLGKLWLDKDGVLLNIDPTKQLVGVESAKSDFFPYSVSVGFSYSSLQEAFWYERKFYILLILLMQLSFLVYYWWHTSRPQSLDEELKRAIKKEEFVPYAQAVVNAKTREIEGVEILMRWLHPIQGVVSPGLFIPQAEESGLIVPMTRLLLRETAKQLCAHSSHLTKPFHVGINISPQHCQGMDLASECKEFIQTVNQENIVLVLELTEREVLDFSESTEVLFSALKNLGCKIAIDDFGTGHSSLANLQKFQVNYIKIDQMFVQGVGNNPISRHLVESTIDLANRLSLEIVAEGVETEYQQDYLTSHHVKYLQGFLFSKPKPLEELLQEYGKIKVHRG